MIEWPQGVFWGHFHKKKNISTVFLKRKEKSRPWSQVKELDLTKVSMLLWKGSNPIKSLRVCEIEKVS